LRVVEDIRSELADRGAQLAAKISDEDLDTMAQMIGRAITAWQTGAGHSDGYRGAA
jgi:hypothetical protein